MMKSSRNGFYSVVQFCPDAARFEAVNIGVILMSPNDQFIEAKLAVDNGRIRKFFGTQNWSFVNAQKSAISERLRGFSKDLSSVRALAEFAMRRSNQIRITEPKSVLLENPKEDLDKLYAELVGVPRRKGSPRVVTELRERLRDAQVDQLVQADIHIEVPILGRQIAAPFGYQNGRFNVVEPVLFETKDREEGINRACRRALEGKSLFEHPEPRLGPVKLIVVGKFGERSARDLPIIENMLRDNDVGFYRMDRLEPLIEEIRSAALAHAPAQAN